MCVYVIYGLYANTTTFTKCSFTLARFVMGCVGTLLNFVNVAVWLGSWLKRSFAAGAFAMLKPEKWVLLYLCLCFSKLTVQSAFCSAVGERDDNNGEELLSDENVLEFECAFSSAFLLFRDFEL